MVAARSSSPYQFEFGDPAGLVPVRDIDVSFMIHEASMRRTKSSGRDAVRSKGVVSPLGLLRVVAEKGDRNVVSVEDDNTSFKFGDDGVVTVKADLAGPSKMLCDGTNIFSVEVEMAESTILPIADKKKGLVVTRVERETMTAIKQARIRSFAGVTLSIVAVAIEAEDARVTVTVGDED